MSRPCHILLPLALLAASGCSCNLELFPDDSDWRFDAGPDEDAGHLDAGSDAGTDAGFDAAVCTEGEICNGLDDDCDGTVDEGVCTTLARHISVNGQLQGEAACAVTMEGRVACWGGRGLVRGDAVAEGRVRPLPTLVDGVEGATEVHVGGYVNCARTDTGATCWAAVPDDIGEWIPASPTPIEELDGASSLSVGPSSYCAVVGGSVICSPNTTGPDPFFTPSFWTVPLEGRPRSVATSGANTFILRRDGTVVGFGVSNSGLLGTGATTGIAEDPVAIEGLTDATEVCTGRTFSCAIHSGGRVACWGGLVGDGTTDPSDVPVDTLLDGATQLTCGSGHACALREDGQAWCWGRNHEGQLGNGTRERALSPVRVALEGVAQIDAGAGTTCAVLTDGTAWCWGNNCHGAVGDGTTDGEVIRDGTCTRLRPLPTRVRLP